MRVLVACEFSGVVRRAFAMRGHDAWSCDILPAEDRSNQHIVGDVRDHLDEGWDLLMVAHPPCTRLCNSGVRWLRTPPPGKSYAQIWGELDDSVELFRALYHAPIPRVAIENPIMHGHARERMPDVPKQTQIVQPWMFGHGETKATCLWLRGLPPLVPTDIVEGREARVHRMSPSKDRWRERSRTFAGIAEAMAEQWSEVV